MVPRHRLMQIQRLHAPQIPVGQVVAVVEENAGPRSVRGAALVRPRRGRLLAECRHRPDLQRGHRNERELLAHARVHPLACGFVGDPKFVRRLGLESRIGAQVPEEFGQRTPEPDLRLLRLHLAQDARHLRQPQPVHRVRLHRQGRVALDKILVQRRAARQRRHSHRVARAGQILVLEKHAQPLVRGVQHALHLTLIGRRQPRPVRRRHRVREGLDRHVEKRSLDAPGQQIVDLPDDVPDHQFGRRDPPRQARPRPDDHAVDHLRVLRVAEQVVVVIRHRLERRAALARRDLRVEGLEAPEMVDGQHVGDPPQRRRVGAQLDLVVGAEHVIGDPVHRRQLAPVDPAQPLQVPFDRPSLLLLGRIGQIFADPVGIAQVAAQQRLDRVALQVGLVAFREQPPKLLALASHLHGGRGLRDG